VAVSFLEKAEDANRVARRDNFNVTDLADKLKGIR